MFEAGLAEGKDDNSFDCGVDGAVVHRDVGRMGEIPGDLCGAVGGKECLHGAFVCMWNVEGCVAGVGLRRDGVVVAHDGCFGEDFGEFVEGGEVDIPTSKVPLKVVEDASDFLGVFLGIGSPEALAHCAVLSLLVGGGWPDCSNVALEVRDDTLREELVV